MKAFLSNQDRQMQPLDLAFEKNEHAEMQLVKLYEEFADQTMVGFGAAFTEAAGYTFASMPAQRQEEFLNLYFGADGNRYNLCRTHIQSCDFALGNYAYVEDEADIELKTFNLDRDKEYLIPLIKRAQEKTPDLSFLASPWSPPAFMKSNGQMNQGGILKKEYWKMWADIFVKYLEEYDNLGISIDRVTVQNEPQAVQTWDSCIFTAEEEAEFVREYLKPALRGAGLDQVKVSVWDHNKDCIIERAVNSLQDPAAREDIDGIAFHWYSGDHFESLEMVHRLFPEKELIFSEGCVEYSRFQGQNAVRNAQMYAHDMIGNINAGACGLIEWNMLLDKQGGPNHVQNFCDAPVMYDAKTDTLDIKLSYYYIGHLTRFVRKGARKILVSTYTDSLDCAAFVNPDGEKVLVVMNKSSKPQKFYIGDKGKTAEVNLGAHAIMTVCW